MKKPVFLWIVWVLIAIIAAGCSEDEDPVPVSSTWDLSVKTPTGSNIAIATGSFTFSSTEFMVTIKTSRIGGADIVKEFGMSGTMSGDTMIVKDFVLNLTDPAETVVVNGKVLVAGNTMGGAGTYSIVQPPDTLYFYGDFVATGTKR